MAIAALEGLGNERDRLPVTRFSLGAYDWRLRRIRQQSDIHHRLSPFDALILLRWSPLRRYHGLLAR
jgi:hypothetical protein